MKVTTSPVRLHSNAQRRKAIAKAIQHQIIDVAKVLDLQEYARIDGFAHINTTQTVTLWMIKINVLPPMTPATCLFHQCMLNGYTTLAFMEAIIAYGLTKQNLNHKVLLFHALKGQD